MKKGLTELVFILDKSGSEWRKRTPSVVTMPCSRSNRSLRGECHITTVLFDNNYTLLHDRIDIKAVSAITEKYQVGGSRRAP